MIIYGKNVIKTFIFKKKELINKIYILENMTYKNKIFFINSCKKNFILLEFINKENKIYQNFCKKKHQGIFADIKELKTFELEDFFNNTFFKKNPVFLMFDQIQDGRNLGAIIRTATSSGVIDCILITKKNSVSITSEVIKTSEGGVLDIPIVFINNVINTIKILKKKSFCILGLDMNGEEEYCNVDYNYPVCIVIGGEHTGIRNLVKKQLDFSIYIPMKKETVNSLNVSVASSILIYEIFRKRRKCRI